MNMPVSIHYDLDQTPVDNPQQHIKRRNLSGVSLFVYSNYFLIDPNTPITGLKSRLYIDKDTLKVHQCDKSEQVMAPERKMEFSAFLGILPVFNLHFLVFVEYVKDPIVMQKHQIYQVYGLAYVPVGNERDYEKHSRWQQVLNYLNYLKNSLMHEGYYFSFTYDLSTSKIKQAEGYPKNFKFCWNSHLAKNFLGIMDQGWMLSFIQGFVRGFSINIQGKKLEYFLITRRSWRKGGTRYNSRGISTKGNVANFCQTQQLIFLDSYCCSHLQIRGSVPAFWKQTGVSATVEFTQNRESNVAAFRKHFYKLKELYDRVLCINLLATNKPEEHQLTLYFQQLVKQEQLNSVRYEYFDFHQACKGNRFENANALIHKLATINQYFKFYAEDLQNNRVILTQRGVFRTNCLDCLDRTNFVQTKIAVNILEVILNQLGIDVSQRGLGRQSLVTALDDAQSIDPLVTNLKHIWADNGDTISIHYTGTGSTHTNITRTGKRDLYGMVEHGMKSLTRFYNQNIDDTYKQEVIDLLIGEHTQTLNLKEYEDRMKSVVITSND